LHPDEQVASLLEATATQAQRRGGAAAAALAMERAAELSYARTGAPSPRRCAQTGTSPLPACGMRGRGATRARSGRTASHCDRSSPQTRPQARNPAPAVAARRHGGQ
jgi:hypothetical protein